MRHLFFGIKYLFDYWILAKNHPLICGIVLHNKCNLRCRHCRIPVERPRAPVGYEEALQVIDTFYADGGRCLYLEGGEPFLWRDKNYTLEDVVVYARKKGYYAVIIYTNGTCPIETSADTIFISVDGLAEIHDKLRGRTFDRIMNNIQTSAHASIYINYTINSVNKEDISGFCAYVEKIPRIKGTFFYFHTPYYGYDELYLDPNEKRDIIVKLLELKRQYRILNSRAGLKSAFRNDWKKNLDICTVYEDSKYYQCCRINAEGTICEDCGYLSYAEIDQTLKLKPSAMVQALKYF